MVKSGCDSARHFYAESQPLLYYQQEREVRDSFVLESDSMTLKLVLASNSPRRRELLALTGWQFSVQPVDIDESPWPAELPADYVRRLAEGKARAAGQHARPGSIILAADTTVVDGDTILGKPADAAEARAMLVSLQGREHKVYTAISVFDPQSGRLINDICATSVWMRSYSGDEIETYIASGDPFDKAGAYAIQNPQFRPVERIEGCYACVVGLPLCNVVRLLAQFGLETEKDLTAACPQMLEIDTPCPEFEKIFFGNDASQLPG
jgi:septum formation protein